MSEKTQLQQSVTLFSLMAFGNICMIRLTNWQVFTSHLDQNINFEVTMTKLVESEEFGIRIAEEIGLNLNVFKVESISINLKSGLLATMTIQGCLTTNLAEEIIYAFKEKQVVLLDDQTNTTIKS